MLPRNWSMNQRWVMHIGVLALCLIPAIVVGLAGLSRPYDAIPDQDLLWASEALRLIRGVAPSYADHPGAFWTLIYKANIWIAQSLGNTEILDNALAITPEGIQSIIRMARVENAVLAGLCAYLVFPSSLAVGIRGWLAASLAAVCGSSSAALVGVSEIRHEIISVAFLITALISYSCCIRSNSQFARRSLSTVAIGLYFCAAFSKNQGNNRIVKRLWFHCYRNVGM